MAATTTRATTITATTIPTVTSTITGGTVTPDTIIMVDIRDQLPLDLPDRAQPRDEPNMDLQ